MEPNPLFDKYGKTLKPGDFLFSEGDSGDEMYIIQEGQVEIVKVLGGQAQVLATLEKGEFFGEMAIVNRIKRTASARASTGLKVLAFDRNGFQQMIEKNPKIALNIIDKLCKRLENTTNQLAKLSSANQKESVYLNLSYLFSEKGGENPDLNLKSLQDELGLNLQIPQSIISEELNELSRKGVIKVVNEQVILQDKKALQKLIKDNETR
ncbi:MAG: hypothetical protein A2Z96_05985 [Spirochaetes bacterium GWB1_48_6]|nr:MAG: hypothetical protein A2Z96_05985 [Spirochaetes bacterium GWB1_48_6]